MFINGDRLPMTPAPANGEPAVRPWALRLMAPYKEVTDVGEIATGIDPTTQLGVTSDGEFIAAKHRKSNTGTEKPTSTARGDGQNPGQDQDHSQDSDQD